MIILIIQDISETALITPILTYAKKKYFYRKYICQSKKKTMWQYFNSELGNEFLIENDLFKLGNVLLITFMFGPGIPILFPLALIYVNVNSLCLRYKLAYQCRKPISYSNDNNELFIKFCAFMPVLYSCFGLWMYSNRQIYDNKVLPRASINGIQDHSHTVVYTLTTFTPGTPFLILLVVALANFIVMVLELNLWKKITFVSELNEKIKALRLANLENFYQYIKQDD